MRGRFRTQKRLLFYGVVHLLRVTALVLPRRAALRLFGAIGGAVRHVDRPAVRRSREHLAIALGAEASVAEREVILRGMFRAVGRNVLDVLRLGTATSERLRAEVAFTGLENLDRALAGGRGVVAVSAHLGNWEVMGAALAARGYELHVVARELFDRRSDRLLNRWRERCGVRVHRAGGSLRPLVRALRAGGMVGVLPDQDTGAPGLFADFFGRPAWTPTLPFVLAERTGAALVPLWVTLGKDGRHRARVLPALTPAAGASTEERVADLVGRWHAVLEEAIRACPEQWVWFHRRWKTRPPAAPPAPGDADAAEGTGSEHPRAVRVRASRRVLISR